MSVVTFLDTINNQQKKLKGRAQLTFPSSLGIKIPRNWIFRKFNFTKREREKTERCMTNSVPDSVLVIITPRVWMGFSCMEHGFHLQSTKYIAGTKKFSKQVSNYHWLQVQGSMILEMEMISDMWSGSHGFLDKFLSFYVVGATCTRNAKFGKCHICN